MIAEKYQILYPPSFQKKHIKYFLLTRQFGVFHVKDVKKFCPDYYCVLSHHISFNDFAKIIVIFISCVCCLCVRFHTKLVVWKNIFMNGDLTIDNYSYAVRDAAFFEENVLCAHFSFFIMLRLHYLKENVNQVCINNTAYKQKLDWIFILNSLDTCSCFLT